MKRAKKIAAEAEAIRLEAEDAESRLSEEIHRTRDSVRGDSSPNDFDRADSDVHKMRVEVNQLGAEIRELRQKLERR